MTTSVDPDVAASVREIVRSIESGSSAELVVEVRRQSAVYAHAEGIAGALLGLAALGFALFSPFVFAPWMVAVVVVACYGLGIVLARWVPALRRLLTTAAEREHAVRQAAAAAFVDGGVGNTRGRTGVLVFLSLFERRTEVIADRGALDAVPVLEWNRIRAGLSQAHDLEAVAAALPQLEKLFSEYLPAPAGDIDELANELRSGDE